MQQTMQVMMREKSLKVLAIARYRLGTKSTSLMKFMMSKSAFNAMLKTLEEPPDAVKFIFATIRKVPVTIYRGASVMICGEFSSRMATHLGMILTEIISAKTDALAAIAQAAEGSVRDALSLLDQAAAMAADKLTNNLVANIPESLTAAHTILSATLNGDCAVALATFGRLIAVAASLKRWSRIFG